MMHALVDFILTTPPPLMVVIVFALTYFVVGLPVHLTRGAGYRDVLGTMAGVFAALVYITLVVDFHANRH
ncbi:hypothetical protein [Burkholderia sp. Ac-20365]|jgi:hypothetical protein|uniref:hypothetical protein n=1 Tax=Burkholderia sp. Ac-20365 TaxID=2703897 RepID=UPI00197BEA62|nr:hypothetical protein [Burkholderia sp. Ac-20365]MBN3761757.1 hypothetical protein [Burkholderia sp. Ac-20365]